MKILHKLSLSALLLSTPLVQAGEPTQPLKKLTYPQQIALLGTLSAASLFISLKAGNAIAHRLVNSGYLKSTFFETVFSKFPRCVFDGPGKTIFNNPYVGDTGAAVCCGIGTTLAGIAAKAYGKNKKTDDAKMSLLVPTVLITPPLLVSAYLLGAGLFH
jgi:hypothetical protein